jgi:hypothetical protein
MQKSLTDLLKNAVKSQDWDRVAWVSIVLFLLIGGVFLFKNWSKISEWIKDIKATNEYKIKFEKKKRELQEVSSGVKIYLRRLEDNHINFNNIAENAKEKVKVAKPSSKLKTVEPQISQLQEIYDLSLQDIKQAIKVVDENLIEAERVSKTAPKKNKGYADEYFKEGK